MERHIVGFHRDEAGDWVAELCCGHNQHTRHKPPFINRPWVSTAAGRRSKLGAQASCVRCVRFELPDGYRPYRRTAEFTEETVPTGLLRAHRTKAGIWAKIHVLSGALAYDVKPPLEEHFVLHAPAHGVIVPEVSHSVAVAGPVRFYVEFYRAGSS